MVTEAAVREADLSQRAAEALAVRETIAARESELRNLREVIAEVHKAASARNLELSSVVAELQSEIVRLSDERTGLRAQLDARTAEPTSARGRLDLDKVIASFLWRAIDRLTYFPRSSGRVLRRPFERIAFHKSGRPRGWLRRLGYGSTRAGAQVSGLTPDFFAMIGAQSVTANSAMKSFDGAKDTILVVAHEGTRSGAPILALNLVQRFSERYNVISLLLEGGELTSHFHEASVAVLVADRRNMNDEQLSNIGERGHFSAAAQICDC